MVRTPSTCATRLRTSAQFLIASSRQKSRSLTTNESAPLSLPAINSQLGTSYIDRLPTPNRQPIEVLAFRDRRGRCRSRSDLCRSLGDQDEGLDTDALSVRLWLGQGLARRGPGGAVMAISAPEKLDGQAVRSELLAIYRGRTGQGFLQSLLDTLSDPIRPVSPQKRRRFHPVLVMVTIVAAIVVSAFAYFTVVSR